MSNVNKIRKDEEVFDVEDPRIPEAPAEGDHILVASDGVASWQPKEEPVKLESIFDGSISEIILTEQINGVRPYICDDLDNLRTLHISKIVGPIGAQAFANLDKLEDFELDPTSVITELGSNAFLNIGVNREGDKRFVMDFRNSTFTSFFGFATPEISASGSGVVQPAIGIYNTEIWLPETVVSFTPSSGGSSGSTGVLNGSLNVDVYFTGPTVPLLDNISNLPSDEASHILVPYAYFDRYHVATNWSSLENLYGFLTAEVGTLLPAYDPDGYEITWYSALVDGEVITRATGDRNFCLGSANRIAALVESKCYRAGIKLLVNDTVWPSDFPVPVGATVTIVPEATVEGKDVLKVFTVDGVDYLEAGSATIVMTSEDILVVANFGAEEDAAINPIFGLNVPSTLAQVFDSCDIPSTWNVGDTIDIPITLIGSESVITVTYRLVHIGEIYDAALGGHVNNILEPVGLYFPASRVDPSLEYSSSSPYSTINSDEFVNQFPEEWRSVFSYVLVPELANDQTLAYAVGRMYLLSPKELIGYRLDEYGYGDHAEFSAETVLDYYSEYLDKYSRWGTNSWLQKKYESATTQYVLRSRTINPPDYYSWIVGGSGYLYTDSSSGQSINYAPCFSLSAEHNKPVHKIGLSGYNGSVVATVNGEVVSLDKYLVEGSEVTLTPVSNEDGYRIAFMSVGNTEYLSADPVTFTLNEDVSVVVVFVPNDAPTVRMNFSDNTPDGLAFAFDNDMQLWPLGSTISILLEGSAEPATFMLVDNSSRYLFADMSGERSNNVLMQVSGFVTSSIGTENVDFAGTALAESLMSVDGIFGKLPVEWREHLACVKVPCLRQRDSASYPAYVSIWNTKLFIPGAYEWYYSHRQLNITGGMESKFKYFEGSPSFEYTQSVSRDATSSQYYCMLETSNFSTGDLTVNYLDTRPQMLCFVLSNKHREDCTRIDTHTIQAEFTASVNGEEVDVSKPLPKGTVVRLTPRSTVEGATLTAFRVKWGRQTSGTEFDVSDSYVDLTLQGDTVDVIAYCLKDEDPVVSPVLNDNSPSVLNWAFTNGFNNAWPLGSAIQVGEGGLWFKLVSVRDRYAVDGTDDVVNNVFMCVITVQASSPTNIYESFASLNFAGVMSNIPQEWKDVMATVVVPYTEGGTVRSYSGSKMYILSELESTGKATYTIEGQSVLESPCEYLLEDYEYYGPRSLKRSQGAPESYVLRWGSKSTYEVLIVNSYFAISNTSYPQYFVPSFSIFKKD